MKSYFQKSQSIVLLLVVILSCSEEGPTATVQFSSREFLVFEDDAHGKLITIRHSAPITTSGTITVTFDMSAGYGKDFITLPGAIGNIITLPILPGQLESSFKVMPVSEPACRERFVKFSIQSVSKGMQTGNSRICYLAIKNADWNVVEFAKPNDYIREKDTLGTLVRIKFSKPASTKGSLSLSNDTYFANSGVYGVDFFTQPEMEFDAYRTSHLTLSYEKEAQEVNFIVFPIYEENRKPEVQVNFYIRKFGLDPCFVVPTNGIMFTLVIIED